MLTADVPGLAAADAAWEAAAARDAYWVTHYSELLARYPEQFVAVHAGVVIAHGPDLVAVTREIESRGLEPRQAWLRFITADPRTTLP